MKNENLIELFSPLKNIKLPKGREELISSMLESNSPVSSSVKNFKRTKIRRFGMAFITTVLLGVCVISIFTIRQKSTLGSSSIGNQVSAPTMTWPSSISWHNQTWVASYPLKTNVSALGNATGEATVGGVVLTVYSIKGVSTSNEIAVLIKPSGPYVVYQPK